MEVRRILFFLVFVLFSCYQNVDLEKKSFRFEKVLKMVLFILNLSIEQVFFLFGVFEERKWELNWELILIYLEQEIIEEGIIFKIKMYGYGYGYGNELEFFWIVIKFNL